MTVMPYETICLGYHRWSRQAVAPFLATPDHRVTFTMSPRRALERARSIRARLALRASGPYGDIIRAARADGLPVIRIEDGFLRSVGLGREMATPLSLVLDHNGIHYDPTAPNDLESLIATAPIGDALLARAEAITRRIKALGLSKYNVGRRTVSADPRRGAGNRPIVLVPGQVETDASVRTGSPDIQRNADLLLAVRRARPDAWILYKPHPDVERGLRKGTVPPEILNSAADHVLTDINASAALAFTDEVHTMTSLMGFEALVRGRSVTTYGGPFYAGWGLTEDHLTFPRRRRRITLDHLVAAALILYPHYRDPFTGLPCAVEDVLDLLSGTSALPSPSPLQRLWRGSLRAMREIRSFGSRNA